MDMTVYQDITLDVTCLLEFLGLTYVIIFHFTIVTGLSIRIKWENRPEPGPDRPDIATIFLMSQLAQNAACLPTDDHRLYYQLTAHARSLCTKCVEHGYNRHKIPEYLSEIRAFMNGH